MMNLPGPIVGSSQSVRPGTWEDGDYEVIGLYQVPSRTDRHFSAMQSGC
jgi:hypothetical protein